jgi:hypothetical protein
MLTVSVRYKSPFSTKDAGDIAIYLTNLLREHSTARFYLIVLPNRTLTVGAPKDEKYERWRVKELRYIRDDKFVPYFLYFSPEPLPQCEYATAMYGGIKGKVEREHPSASLYFYLLADDLRLSTEQQQAGATKEAVREILRVETEGGIAILRPLLCDGNAILTVKTDAPSFAVFYPICHFLERVFAQ